jgi:hypothetical protein
MQQKKTWIGALDWRIGLAHWIGALDWRIGLCPFYASQSKFMLPKRRFWKVEPFSKHFSTILIPIELTTLKSASPVNAF